MRGGSGCYCLLEGLFHHFPTREVLVEAVVDALVKRLDMISGEEPRHEEIGSPREARAYIEECLDPVMVLAVESFTLVDVFNLYAFSDQEIEAIKGELLARMKA